MEVAYQACIAFGAVAGVFGGIFFSKHMDSLGIWSLFTMLVLFSLGVCLVWQKNVWDKKDAMFAAKQQVSLHKLTAHPALLCRYS